MVKAMVSRSATPASSTIESATRLCLAKLRPGTPKTSSSAEKSEAKMRRDVQASRRRPGHWKRCALLDERAQRLHRVAGRGG